MYRLLLSVLLSMLTACSSQDNMNCYYYYMAQPSSDRTCNPWPLVTAESNSTLTLHCNIIAPQNNELPNVQWFIIREEEAEQEMLYPGGSDRKYSNPISSKDISASVFKRVNFSLVIHDVNDDDVGCYLCEVHVTDGNSCWFDMRPSSQFCLLEEDEYDDKDACESIPINDSFVCASNMTCDSATQTGLPLVSTIQLPPISFSSSQLTTESGQSLLESLPPVTTIVQPLITSKAKLTSLSATLTGESGISKSRSLLIVPVMSTVDTLQVVSSATKQSSASSQTTSSTNVTSKRLSIQDTSTQHTTSVKIATASGHPNVRNSLTSFTTTTGSSQLQLRLGLYVGVGVCSLLLVVILILLAAVAILCRKKVPGMKRLQENEMRRSTSVTCSSPEPEESRIWTRTNSSQPTAVVNDESVIRLLTSHSLPPSNEILTSNIDHPHTETTSERGTQDQDDSSRQRNGGYDTELQHSGSIPTADSSVKRSKGHSKGTPSHHRLSLTNGYEDERHMTSNIARTKARPTSHRPSSPETHYYHVLEEPRYYNFNWLARNAEGRELILQNRGGEKEKVDERAISSPNNHGNEESQRDEIRSEDCTRHNSTQYDYADLTEVGGNGDHKQFRPRVLDDDSPTERDQYHWTVLLSPSKKTKSETMPSAKKQNRQMYARLDCSTMEPKREYTQVNITHKDNEQD